MTNLSQTNGTDKSRIHQTVNVHTSIEEITPQKAENWLKRNLQQNRPKSERHIDYLSHQMKEGYWKVNGEAIKFDLSNNLIDGQHRLQAVVNSGVTIHSLVVRGIPTDFFYTMDVGKRRNTADSLSFSGYKNSKNLAAAVMYAGRINSKWSGRTLKASAGDTFKFIESNPGIKKSTTYALKLYQTSRYRGISASLGAALHFIFSKKDFKAADKFFYDLYTGANLAPDSMMLMLRNKIVDTGNKKTPVKVKLVYVIKTWTCLRLGKKVKVLSYNPKKDHFPKIV